MTTPKPCESGACIHVHEEGGIVHIRSTETGDSMTATPAEWQDYLAGVRRDERALILREWLEATQADLPEPGDAPEPSQIHLRNPEEATREELLTELRNLDRRLRWQYRHNEQGTFVSLMAAKKIAEQRDDALARISELELANKTLEIALKHSADLNGTLTLQRNQVLNLISDDQVAEVPYWLRKDIRNIYAGKEQT